MDQPNETQTAKAQTLTGGSFDVTVDGVAVNRIRSVTIPGNTSKITEYRDGKPVWGETEFDDLYMERVFDPADTVLYDWRMDVRNGKIEDGKRLLKVVLNDSSGTPQIKWELSNAWPKEYHQLSLEASVSSDAAAYDDVPTESVRVRYDDIVRSVL